MADEKIICEGYFDIPEGQVETVLAGYETHVRLSREEPGNLRYDYRLDPEVPGRVHVEEAYVNRAAFDAHLARTGASPWPEIRRDVVLNIDVKTGG